MQLLKALRPTYVATDIDEKSLPPDAAKFIKGVRLTGGSNANLTTGTGDGKNSGNNQKVLATVPGNIAACNIEKPAGINKTIGSYQSDEVNMTFQFNWNSNGNHGIYMIDGETLQCHKVIMDSMLRFSIDPQYAIPAHRVQLKVVYSAVEDGTRSVKEVYLIFTDGSNWQRYIPVFAAIRTNGFDATQYAYWKVFGPHFDREEFIDYPYRPPMWCPLIEAVPPTPEDEGKKNNLLDGSVQIAYAFLLTDGRMTTLSPYSLPFYVDKGCSLNNTNLTRCLNVTLNAGSALVEKIYIYRRFCSANWSLYDVISKFNTCGDNDPAVIGNEYWKRVNPWAEYSFDTVNNTIVYQYCGDKGCALLSPAALEDVRRFSNDIPITSVGLTSAGDAMLLANNKYFYDPLDCKTLANLKINITTAPPSEACQIKNRKITLYSYIGRNGEQNCFAYTKGEDKTVRFGGVVMTPEFDDGAIVMGVAVDEDESNLFGLNFGDNQGFICYLRGTPYYAIGRQYKVDKDGNKEFVGPLDIAIESQLDLAAGVFQNGGYFIMQYDFIVPAGKYIATLARHTASLSSDYPSTSTYIYGIANSMLKPANSPNITQDHLVTRNKEMEIDVCNQDVDVWKSGMDLIYVMAPRDYKSGLNERWRFIEGYVKEERDSSVGVELLSYFPTQGDPDFWRHGTFTDHNGFYFAFTARGDAKSANVQFNGKFNCVVAADIFRTTGLPSNQRGYFISNVYVADHNLGNFGKCNRILVRGKVVDCAEGTGISGVAVTLTRGMTTYTSTDGTFELIAHNHYEGIRQDRVYMNASGACLLVGCDCGCNPVFPYSDNAIPCVNCEERIYPNPMDASFKVVVNRSKSLKGGAKIAWGIEGFDLAGRGTLVGRIATTDIPTFLERGGFMTVEAAWEVTGPLNLPPHIKYISFFRTENLNFGPYLQWVGDKIEYLDIKGDVVSSPSSAIRARITIQSLNEYNIANKFSSTTKYQFVEGDRVRIYDDGEGNLFDPATSGGFMDYQILGTNWDDTPVQGDDEPVDDGKSFIIPFDRRLEKLKDKCGFWIELQRPTECKDKEFYCEICGMYPVVNGEIAGGLKTGKLNTWDTYYQQRFFQIKSCSNKSYLHPFESISITDFFGENCGSCGRISVRDDTIVQRWYPDDIIKSDEYVNEGGYNGIGNFRENNRKQFKGQEGGGIVSIHAERNIIFVLLQNDWYILDYNMNVVRVTAEGLVVANLDQNLSDPHQKVGSNYGCDYGHTSGIQYANGLVFWPSASCKGWIMSDWKSAADISQIDNKNYFIDKFSYMAQLNNKLPADKLLYNMMEVVSGVDRESMDVYVTFRPRRFLTANPSAYVNELREQHIPHQETFVFNVGMKKWVRWEGFTPEYYCTVRNSRSDSKIITFAAGQAYYHGGSKAKVYNEFYGIKTEMVVEMVYSEDDDKVKVFQSVVADSNNMKWWVDKITTNEANAFSYIPPAYFEKKENVWYAHLMADMNTYPDPMNPYKKMFNDGKRMRGLFARIRVVQDQTRLGEYTELSSVWLRTIASERSNK